MPQPTTTNEERSAPVLPADRAQLPERRNVALKVVLYVEDNPANMLLVEQLLERRPELHLLKAINGAEGIAMALAHQPQVILLDNNLPGISGIQVLKLLQQDEETAHIPVLAVSANAMADDIEAGLAAGYFRYITKPIQINEFMDALDEALKTTESKSNNTSTTRNI